MFFALTQKIGEFTSRNDIYHPMDYDRDLASVFFNKIYHYHLMTNETDERRIDLTWVSLSQADSILLSLFAMAVSVVL